jgi:hypothetical protein
MHAPSAVPGLDQRHASQHAWHEAAPDPDVSPGKSNCKDCCEKPSASISSLKSVPDSGADALPHSAIALLWSVPEALHQRVLSPRRNGDPAPPITIAFLRLTL